ncbi:MAG: hypothetical protein ACE5PM_06915 [Candidatus Hydrothermarchaeales archaeon]
MEKFINDPSDFYGGAKMSIGCDYCGNEFMSPEAIVGRCQHCGKKVCYYCSEFIEKESENGLMMSIIYCPDCFEKYQSEK